MMSRWTTSGLMMTPLHDVWSMTSRWTTSDLMMSRWTTPGLVTTPLYDVWSNDVTLNNVCSNDVTLNDVTFDKMSSGEKSWGRSNPFTLTLKSFIDHPSDKMLLGILGCGRSHAALGGRGTVIVLERLRVSSIIPPASSCLPPPPATLGGGLVNKTPTFYLRRFTCTNPRQNLNQG